jgi:hypothetical protein
MAPPTADPVAPGDVERGEIEWVARRSHHVSKTIKGLLLALAAALALELTVDAGAAALALAVSVIGVMAADLYEHAVQQEVETASRIDRRSARALMGSAIGIAAGASLAFALFILAWLEVITTELAIDTAIWSGIGVLFALGYLSARMRSEERGRALMHGSVLALIGIGVLALKTLH